MRPRPTPLRGRGAPLSVSRLQAASAGDAAALAVMAVLLAHSAPAGAYDDKGRLPLHYAEHASACRPPAGLEVAPALYGFNTPDATGPARLPWGPTRIHSPRSVA